jgi:hypothetical protein
MTAKWLGTAVHEDADRQLLGLVCYQHLKEHKRRTQKSLNDKGDIAIPTRKHFKALTNTFEMCSTWPVTMAISWTLR